MCICFQSQVEYSVDIPLDELDVDALTEQFDKVHLMFDKVDFKCEPLTSMSTSSTSSSSSSSSAAQPEAEKEKEPESGGVKKSAAAKRREKKEKRKAKKAALASGASDSQPTFPASSSSSSTSQSESAMQIDQPASLPQPEDELPRLLAEIKRISEQVLSLRKTYQSLFEWHDGVLVQAMKQGTKHVHAFVCL